VQLEQGAGGRISCRESCSSAAVTANATKPPGDYGYHWWVTNETGHDSFRAMGFGGQLIQVILELDLVVVITSAYTQERFDAPNLVGATIAPAVTG
jgi:CubicO group peptidase (beta-lactamase class C family)